MSDESDGAPRPETTQAVGKPPLQYGDSSADFAARFAVLRDPSTRDRSTPSTDGAAMSRYEFGETFARGGIGRIRRAFDRRLQRHVAVKELLDHRGDSAKARFMREALITARLEHPAIIPIHDVGTYDDGNPYYCMKLVEGRSLEAIVRSTPALAERLALLPHVLAVADALAYAHDKQVIHRDLKPSNVLVGSFGETVIIDWGLTKDLRGAADEPSGPEAQNTWRDGDGNTALTQTGELLGTLPFMPLEQATGRDVGPSADVYAAGALLYFVLSGRPPYEGRNATAIYHQILATSPPDILILAPGISPDLAAIVRRAMARGPADRYSGARELAEDLRRYQSGRMVHARTYSPMDVLRYFVTRYRAVLTIGSISVVLLIALGIFSFSRISREAAEAELQRSRAEHNRALAEHKSTEAEKEAQRARNTAFTALLNSGRQLLFEQRQPEEALPVLNTAYKLAPDDRRIKLLLGEATIPADSLLHDFSLPAAVVQVRINPSGQNLLALDGDGQLHLWRIKDGMSEEISKVPLVNVFAAEFAGEGILVGASDEILYLEDGVRRWRRPGPPQRILSFDLIPRVPHVFVLEESGVTVLDLASGNVQARWLPKKPSKYMEAFPQQANRDDLLLLAHFLPDKAGTIWPFTLLRWNSRNGRVSEVYSGNRHNLHSVTLSPDGRRISYVGGSPHEQYSDETHFVVDVAAPGEHRPLDRCEYSGSKIRDQDAVFSPDGGKITRLINKHHLVTWDVETRRCENTALLSNDDFDRIRASEDGRVIVAVGRNGAIAVFDGESLALRRQFSAGAALVTDVVLSSDGSMLAVGDAAGHVRLWNLQDPRIVPPYPAYGVPASVSSAPMLLRLDGEHIALEQIQLGPADAPPKVKVLDPALDTRITASTDDFLLTFDAQGRATIWSLATGERLCADISLDERFQRGSIFASDADSVLIAQRDDTFEASENPSRFENIDVSTCRSIGFLVHPGVRSLAVALNIDRGIVDGPGARILDTSTGAFVAGPEADDNAWSFVTLFPDRRRAVVDDGSGGIQILDMLTGVVLARLKTPKDLGFRYVFKRAAAFFSPDGATFITPSPHGSLDVWDAETWEWRGTLGGHVRDVDNIVFSEDSSQALSFTAQGLGGDANVFLWDLDADGEGTRLAVRDVSAASFDSSGAMLATGTRDGVIYLWDTPTGDQVGRLEGDTSHILLLKFSVDGQYLLASSWGRIIVWKIPFEMRTPEELDELMATRILDAGE